MSDIAAAIIVCLVVGWICGFVAGYHFRKIMEKAR